jgi:hypothetical protein
MPVSDPKKILKPRGFLKKATVVYQPKSTQYKAKIPLETINPKLVPPKTKIEAHSTTSGVREGETSTIKFVSIDIPSVIELNFPTSQSI